MALHVQAEVTTDFSSLQFTETISFYKRQFLIQSTLALRTPRYCGQEMNPGQYGINFHYYGLPLLYYGISDSLEYEQSLSPSLVCRASYKENKQTKNQKKKTKQKKKQITARSQFSRGAYLFFSPIFAVTRRTKL